MVSASVDPWRSDRQQPEAASSTHMSSRAIGRAGARTRATLTTRNARASTRLPGTVATSRIAKASKAAGGGGPLGYRPTSGSTGASNE